MSKIKTTHVYPPIPIRDFDWCAFFEDEEFNFDDGLRGWGKTEKEAIDALWEQVDE